MSILEILLQYLNPLKSTLEKEIQNNYIYVCMFFMHLLYQCKIHLNDLFSISLKLNK